MTIFVSHAKLMLIVHLSVNHTSKESISSPIVNSSEIFHLATNLDEIQKENAYNDRTHSKNIAKLKGHQVFVIQSIIFL